VDAGVGSKNPRLTFVGLALLLSVIGPLATSANASAVAASGLEVLDGGAPHTFLKWLC